MDQLKKIFGEQFEKIKDHFIELKPKQMLEKIISKEFSKFRRNIGIIILKLLLN